MSGQQSETGDTSFERLAGGIRRLERLLRTLRVSGKTVLYDLAVVDFSSQVLEAAKATILLQLSEVPRVSWTTARLSFEAMHDLFYLVELCPDRLEAGARVYVSALAAKAKSRGILDRAAREAEIEAPPDERIRASRLCGSSFARKRKTSRRLALVQRTRSSRRSTTGSAAVTGIGLVCLVSK